MHLYLKSCLTAKSVENSASICYFQENLYEMPFSNFKILKTVKSVHVPNFVPVIHSSFPLLFNLVSAGKFAESGWT